MEPKYQLNLTEEQLQILTTIFQGGDTDTTTDEYQNLKTAILDKDLIELDQ